MFFGEYNHTIDAKGRLIVPAKLREQLGEAFVVTKGMDGHCLSVYPMEEWKILEEKLRALPLNDPDGRLLTRYLMAGAVFCELDKQGRVLIPSVLREFAQLEKEVVLAGSMDHVEIWNKQRWQDINTVDDIGDVLSRLQQKGINL
ncbi:MAG: division/cell wall cluster transcriptional repressor MraZ [Lachnospiraceae bacterium]|nr:division/cell wall cluster transcriptional repressor MraZ [Lachnospiraceae bacterium]